MLPSFLIHVFVSAASLSLSPTPCGSVEYYVTPTSPPNTDCPQPCYTLDYYALNTTLLSNKENVSLLFLEGRHQVGLNLTISNTSQLYVATFERSNLSLGKASLYLHSEIVFRNITFLQIEYLEIIGNSEITETIMNHNVFGVLLYQVSLVRVKIKSSVSAKVNFSNRTLFINTFERVFKQLDAEFKDMVKNESSPSDSLDCKDTNCLYLAIVNCSINITSIDYCYSGSDANIEVAVTNTAIINSKGFSVRPYSHNTVVRLRVAHSFLTGSNAALHVYTGLQRKNNTVIVYVVNTDIKLEAGSCLRIGVDTTRPNKVFARLFNSTLVGGASGLRADVFMLDNKQMTRTSLDIVINKCKLVGNRVGVISDFPTYVSVEFNLIITDCTFSENGEAIQLMRSKDQVHVPSNTVISHTSVVLQRVTITRSEPLTFAVITVSDVNLIILDCRFVDNAGTAVNAYFSDVTLAGNTLFHNNSGIIGGALSLHHSFLYISRYSSILFRDNHASKVGGAICLKRYPQLTPGRNPPCFYQIGTRHVTNSSAVLGVRFVNNSAQKGGDDIYGGSLYSPCTIFDYSPYQSDYITETFPSYKPTTLSSVTSDPMRVCLCNDQGTPQCASMEYIYRELPPRYPGEVFTVPAVVVGYDFGTVPGIVHSDILQNERDISLARSQYLQRLSSHVKCTDLYFSIQSALTDTNLTLELQVSRIGSIIDKGQIEFDIKWYEKYNIINNGLLHHPVLLNIILKDCPPGFILSKKQPYSCNCHTHLKDKGVRDCKIINGTGWVFRSGAVWVSASFGENETNNFVINDNCPYDYCNKNEIPVDLRFPDTQCAFNHSGILCGGCYGSLSLALGTSRCLPCDNRYVSLLIVFLFAGLVLVFFIKLLDLTVAKGTINGLIFYANIVWANKSILFPRTETLHPAQQLLQTFLAWLNLDLGVETCFIDGLDAYWKTWLQFVFPLYLWTIAGIVITISHYSTRASKIFGNNSVPVLATLILLSYAKLLRTIITSLGFSLLHYPEGTRVVWSFDGNIPYFGAAHSILFLVALAALLLLWLPYTTVLLTLQWLRRKSYLKPLRWINRWKPFFDAYFGNLKPKHHYWVGLLLLVRVVLLVLFAATSALLPKFNILTLVLVAAALLGYIAIIGPLYKLRYVSVIENMFLVNIIVVAGATLYMEMTGLSNSVVIYTSIAIVFVKFVLIVIYHIWCRARGCCKVGGVKEQSQDSDGTISMSVVEFEAVRPQFVDYSQYREPLLDSDSI